jgi:hypothetical protein
MAGYVPTDEERETARDPLHRFLALQQDWDVVDRYIDSGLYEEALPELDNVIVGAIVLRDNTLDYEGRERAELTGLLAAARKQFILDALGGFFLGASEEYDILTTQIETLVKKSTLPDVDHEEEGIKQLESALQIFYRGDMPYLFCVESNTDVKEVI